LYLSQINTKNVAKLKVLCTYDTWRITSFETGLIMVEGALIGTTEFDIFSIDPSTCGENWRTHEEYPAYILPTNRGAAYLDGRLFRGTDDGRVLAYDFKTGKRLWEATIADVKRGEDVPAAPIAWEGLVFIGNAGGDFKGAKGHMYALDAKTGKIVWQFFLVPKTEGDTVRGPEGASPLNDSTWKNVPGVPISGGGTWTSTTLDPASGLLYVPVGNPARLRQRRPPGGQSLHRLRGCPRRQDRRVQEPFPACAQGLARLGRLQPAGFDQDERRQEAYGGVAEGRKPLRL
jgi:glucose dehydrogenase